MNMALIFAAGLALMVAVGAALAVPVMLLWNGVMPNLFSPSIVKPIDFWNAWGLLVLCGLLFKSSVTSKST